MRRDPRPEHSSSPMGTTGCGTWEPAFRRALGISSTVAVRVCSINRGGSWSEIGERLTAQFAHRHRRRLTLVSRFCPDANLYEPPPVVIGKRNGRPRKKGAKLPSPGATVAQAPRTAMNVPWYGGGRRDVEVVNGTGQWYKSGEGLVPVCWVFVHDCTGTHRDDYFFSTDPEMTPLAVIERITGRWSIETTFQEMRPYLGLGDDAGPDRSNGVATGAVPVRAVLGGGVALRPAAHAIRGPRPRWIGRGRSRRRSPTRSRR